MDRSYYLASRCVRTSGVMAQFGVFAMGHVRAALSLGISVNSYTPETSEPGDFYIRPVVSLTPKVTPTIAETKDGINYWTFETN